MKVKKISGAIHIININVTTSKEIQIFLINKAL